MADQSKNARILIVTPEVIYLPDRKRRDMASFFYSQNRGPFRRFSRPDHGPVWTGKNGIKP
jgi:hypothetical protein